MYFYAKNIHTEFSVVEEHIYTPNYFDNKVDSLDRPRYHFVEKLPKYCMIIEIYLSFHKRFESKWVKNKDGSFLRVFSVWTICLNLLLEEKLMTTLSQEHHI